MRCPRWPRDPTVRNAWLRRCPCGPHCRWHYLRYCSSVRIWAGFTRTEFGALMGTFLAAESKVRGFRRMERACTVPDSLVERLRIQFRLVRVVPNCLPSVVQWTTISHAHRGSDHGRGDTGIPGYESRSLRRGSAHTVDQLLGGASHGRRSD